MSIETNKELVLAYCLASRDRDEARWDALIVPNSVQHNLGLDFAVE
jgi:hypothetical protein